MQNKIDADRLVVSFSYGVDSMAMLVKFHRLGVMPKAIVFADVGSEKGATYAYQAVANAWIAKVGLPAVTVVRNVYPKSPYTTIEGNMVMNATLPGATFGMGSCTMKAKICPQNKWAKETQWIQDLWNSGGKILKAIGFEAEEEYRKKRACDKQHADKKDASRFDYWYPLQDWGWTRKQCKLEIAAEGLPVPPKSSCFFCPNIKPWEIDELTPEERGRIMRIEVVAEPYNRKVAGLWRSVRKKDGRPGSITEYILKHGLEYIHPDEIEKMDPMPLNPNCGKFRRREIGERARDGEDLQKLAVEYGVELEEVDEALETFGGRTFKKDGPDIWLSEKIAEYEAARKESELRGIAVAGIDLTIEGESPADKEELSEFDGIQDYLNDINPEDDDFDED